MIGDSLSDFDVAILQAVSNGCGGCRMTSVDGIGDVIESHRNCRAAEGATQEEIRQSLARLEKECLVVLSNHKKTGEELVGLTDDGERCNFIEVW